MLTTVYCIHAQVRVIKSICKRCPENAYNSLRLASTQHTVLNSFGRGGIRKTVVRMSAALFWLTYLRDVSYKNVIESVLCTPSPGYSTEIYPTVIRINIPCAPRAKSRRRLTYLTSPFFRKHRLNHHDFKPAERKPDRRCLFSPKRASPSPNHPRGKFVSYTTTTPRRYSNMQTDRIVTSELHKPAAQSCEGYRPCLCQGLRA